MIKMFLFVIMVFNFNNLACSQSLFEVKKSAENKYNQEQYDSCAFYYLQLIQKGDSTPDTYYSLACCMALSNQTQIAIEYLKSAIKKGYRNSDWLKQDTDLISLRNHPDWEKLIIQINDNHAEYIKTINVDIYKLFEEDQKDRMVPMHLIDQRLFIMKDSLRFIKAKKLLKAGALKAADDFFYAAFIFQHGMDSNSHYLANELSKKAVEMGCTIEKARWLVAASKDRYLLSTGKPQWYGTQFQIQQNGTWILQPLDTTAVSDDERILLNVPTILETLKSLEERNKQLK